MEQITTYLIIIASVMTVKPIGTESKNDTLPKSDRRYYQVPQYINVCDIQERRSKIHCYCDSSMYKESTRADCWIFGEGMTENDPIWPSFSSQSEIEHLIFNVRSDDALTFIPAKAIVRLDKLKYFSIQFGTIRKIPPYVFTNSSTIRQIVLKSNKIMNLEKHSFSQMMMLSNLSLDDNQITELKRDVFFNLPNLHGLHLSNNNLSLVHEGCFKHLNNLLELNLDFNYISVITKETFEGLENLSRLNLRNNKLTMIGNLAFSELWGLKELMLDNNMIEFISERAFGGLMQLRKLTLSGNKLSSFYEDILVDIRSLLLLDLRDNVLGTISYESIRTIVDNDKSSSVAIYLEGNPLECDCRLSWVYALRNETKDITLKHTLEKISCVTNDEEATQRNDELNDEDTNNIHLNVADNYDYYEKNEDFTEKTEGERYRMLVEIPIEALPCPKELMQTIEESYGLPVQNEIRLKALSGVSKTFPNFPLAIALAKLLC